MYKTTVIAEGGRKGSVRSDDGALDISLSMPRSLGGPGTGDGTNPEQLFAACYAACFENAILHIARQRGKPLPDDSVKVAATVALVPNGLGGFRLTVEIATVVTGVDKLWAEEIVREAHAVCPYSNAISGNVDVDLKIEVR